MLNPMTFVTLHTPDHLELAQLNPDGTPTGEYNFPTDGHERFADRYDTYATEGVVPGAINDRQYTNESILASMMLSPNALDPSFVVNFATALANYWATVAVQPGTPAHGGTSVVSVVNNCATLVPDFQAAILASINLTQEPNWFLTFITNVQAVVQSKGVWTVTEVIPNTGPVPFPEKII